MEKFRFAIMGAGNIAVRFREAVQLLDGCEVCAVASKSLERAKTFAEKNHLDRYYDDYTAMLEQEKPDCVYIAVTPNDHARLSLLCIAHDVPVLCEKAMFQNSREAEEVYEAAAKKKIFVMEALWSRYLPAVRKVKEWIEEGRIGVPVISQFSIGFLAPPDPKNRYHSPDLGGGAAKDITVYAYEITTFLLNQKIRNMAVSAVWGETGVDLSNQISIDFEHTLASLSATFAANVENSMVLYGEKGKIVLPFPHYASECCLYDSDGSLVEHYYDKETQNGFTYEIEDAVTCIREGRTESAVVPWADTMACAKLFDRINETKSAL